MVEKRYPTRHTTIGSVIDAGLSIRGFCLDCGHDPAIDLVEVARKLGRKQSSLPVYLVPKVHCDVCNSKNVGTYLADNEAADAVCTTEFESDVKPEKHYMAEAEDWQNRRS